MTDKSRENETAIDMVTRIAQEAIARKNNGSSTETDNLKVTSIELPENFQPPDQLELFALEILDFEFNLKDEIDGMTLPIFAINQKSQQDTLYTWIRHDGKVKMRVDTPAGRPTQHDKDLVIFLVSSLIHEFNTTGNVPDIIEMHTRHYLLGTDRKDGGAQYKQFAETLKRIQHTTVVVEIDNEDGTKTIKDNIAYISEPEVTVRSTTGQVMAVRMNVSDWLKAQIRGENVLTINRDYFKLTGSLERRLYELARKFCGDKAIFTIGLNKLYNYTGSSTSLREFKRMLGDIKTRDSLPDYRINFKGNGIIGLMVEIYSKDTKKIAGSLLK